MTKKKDLSKKDRETWETYIKNPSDVYDKDKNNQNDPYITDSVGWGYYLTGRYVEAEKFMKKAIILMPNDPIVNDHYGDILWRLDKKLQAKFYWESVLKSKDADEDLKKKVKAKLLLGLS